MARSVVRAARAAGLERAALARLRRAHDLAMQPRLAALDDDHHPAYLHPGRSVLIVLRDVGPLDGTALAVAALLESEDADLRVPPERVARAIGPDVAGALGSIPGPGEKDLVERLVGLPAGLAIAALAERLDQLRHLHLRPDLRSRWGERHREALAVWLPVAGRVDARLATRFAHWAGSFERRL